MSCGPAIPMYAARIDGVAMAADHCSSITGPIPGFAHGMLGALYMCSAMCEDVVGPATTRGTALGTARCWAVSGLPPQSRCRVHSCTFRCAECPASTAMVGRLCI